MRKQYFDLTCGQAPKSRSKYTTYGAPTNINEIYFYIMAYHNFKVKFVINHFRAFNKHYGSHRCGWGQLN